MKAGSRLKPRQMVQPAVAGPIVETGQTVAGRVARIVAHPVATARSGMIAHARPAMTARNAMTAHGVKPPRALARHRTVPANSWERAAM